MQRQLNVELSKCDIYWHLGSILPYDISDLPCYIAFILWVSVYVVTVTENNLGTHKDKMKQIYYKIV